MIRWMRAYNASGRGPVQFTGFDMQFPKVAAENVQSFLEKTDPGYWREIRNLYAKVGRLDLPGDDAAETTKQLEKPLAAVVTHLETNAAHYRKNVPVQEVAWAVQNARVVMQAVRVISGSGTYRDQAMAENIGWILRQNPGAKMVVWAHNGHVEQREGWMGNYLSERYGKDYLAVGFSMDQGTYTAYNQEEGVLTTNKAGAAPERTVDGFLNEAKLPRFVLDVRQAGRSPAKSWLAESRLFRSIGAVSVTDTDAFTPTTVNKGFDLLVFIAKTTPSVLLH